MRIPGSLKWPLRGAVRPPRRPAYARRFGRALEALARDGVGGRSVRACDRVDPGATADQLWEELTRRVPSGGDDGGGRIASRVMSLAGGTAAAARDYYDRHRGTYATLSNGREKALE